LLDDDDDEEDEELVLPFGFPAVFLFFSFGSAPAFGTFVELLELSAVDAFGGGGGGGAAFVLVFGGGAVGGLVAVGFPVVGAFGGADGGDLNFCFGIAFASGAGSGTASCSAPGG